MNTLGNLMNKLFDRKTYADRGREQSNESPAEWGIFMKRRNDALNILQSHGLNAYYYLPAIKITDNGLAEACRFLASSGYIITDQAGNFVGKIAIARPAGDGLVIAKSVGFKIHTRST